MSSEFEAALDLRPALWRMMEWSAHFFMVIALIAPWLWRRRRWKWTFWTIVMMGLSSVIVPTLIFEVWWFWLSQHSTSEADLYWLATHDGGGHLIVGFEILYRGRLVIPLGLGSWVTLVVVRLFSARSSDDTQDARQPG